jgi:hypothetical protein
MRWEIRNGRSGFRNRDPTYSRDAFIFPGMEMNEEVGVLITHYLILNSFLFPPSSLPSRELRIERGRHI